MKDIRLQKDWKQVLESEFQKAYWQELTEFVRTQYSETKVYPSAASIFRAFKEDPR